MKISILMTMALIMFGALFTSCSKDDKVKVSSVKLSVSTLTLKTGEKAELKATITPSNATDAIVTWSTSATTVATVDDKGNVTAYDNAGIGTKSYLFKNGVKTDLSSTILRVRANSVFVY